MILISVIIGFMIIAALFAIESRNVVASVISLGTVGLGLSLTFLLLKSPDLAAILLIVEIITITTLLRMTATFDTRAIRSYGWATEAGAILFLMCFIAIAWEAFRSLPPFGMPILKSDEMYSVILSGGIINRVTAVALGARSLETVGGMIALVIAAVGAGALMRTSPRRKS
ncbi:MAG: hydrogenase subunit MbhD domain-containing protein [Endomicrobiales bacterium]